MIIAITSGKGGTGKTTVASAIGACLAAMEKKTLCVDMDFTLPNMDLALGMSDLPIMDMGDVVLGRCTLDEAVIEHSEIKGLYLLSGPTKRDGERLSDQNIQALMEDINTSFDYGIIDCPAGLGNELYYSSVWADMALVVSTLDATSLRDAQRTVMELDEMSVKDIYLIVNRAKPQIFRRTLSSVDDMIDFVGLPLIGVVPEDSDVLLTSAKGKSLILNSDKKASKTLMRITRRILGEKIPLKYR